MRGKLEEAAMEICHRERERLVRDGEAGIIAPKKILFKCLKVLIDHRN